jgi:hypothetical protein
MPHSEEPIKGAACHCCKCVLKDADTLAKGAAPSPAAGPGNTATHGTTRPDLTLCSGFTDGNEKGLKSPNT